MEAAYHFSGEGPIYWPMSLDDVDVPSPRLVAFPRVVVAADGEALWTEGARSRLTLADLERTRAAGHFAGDSRGVFLERPMHGEGIPGWEDFLQWLEEFVFLGGVAWFVAFVRRHLPRWRSRGSSTPFAFLDLVVAREKWDRGQLAQLLGVSEKEAHELLESFGFQPSSESANLWIAPSDPAASPLRRKIIRDWLHHEDHHEEGESSTRDD